MVLSGSDVQKRVVEKGDEPNRTTAEPLKELPEERPRVAKQSKFSQYAPASVSGVVSGVLFVLISLVFAFPKVTSQVSGARYGWIAVAAAASLTALVTLLLLVIKSSLSRETYENRPEKANSLVNLIEQERQKHAPRQPKHKFVQGSCEVCGCSVAAAHYFEWWSCSQQEDQ